MTYDDIAVGDVASFSALIDAALVENFARLSGDTNPLHVDAAYAAGTPFGKPIAHGMIAGALFSRLIGVHLPGKYAVYLSQTLKFHEPIAIGGEVTVRGEVTHTTDVHKTVAIHTILEDSSTKKILVSGDAMVKLLQ